MLIFRLMLLFSLSFLSFSNVTYDSIKVIRYIEKYSDLAIEQEIKYGIPAVVTLAQAILESDAGTSLLTQISNNHFGIKSHKEWQGESVFYHDDTLYEKFRKYSSATDSFEDHSLFLLSRPRYKNLFKYNRYQWIEWCFGLQECGYATSKNYAAKLITIIEKFNLFSVYFSEKLVLKVFPNMSEKEIIISYDKQSTEIANKFKITISENLLTFVEKNNFSAPKLDN